jgi:DNA-binding CsgD family transcriptional regulator
VAVLLQALLDKDKPRQQDEEEIKGILRGASLMNEYSLYYNVPQKSPTAQQLKVLEAYSRLGSQKAVAGELNISVQTVRNHMSQLYVRLGVGGAMEALSKLGWVRSPLKTGTVPCGWLAYCSRHEDHRGQHGGFRPFVRKDLIEEEDDSFPAELTPILPSARLRGWKGGSR